MEEHYRLILRDSESRLEDYILVQNVDHESLYFGSFTDGNGVREAKVALYRLQTITACYLCADSRYYHNSAVYERIIAGLSYVKSVQHENGLFDYVSCNFNSAPDTAFCLVAVIPLLRYLLHKPDKSAEEKNICDKLYDIADKGSHGIMHGGFHTPNHRWAIAGMLKMCAGIFNDEKMSKSADIYLAEGIDCNEDGEYSEKSAGNYNGVNNDAMIMLSEATGDKSFEEHVCRNLRMMFHYIEPDDSIFTANSTRFDKDRLVYPVNYYTEYMLMGVRHDIPEFLGMCNAIMDIVKRRGLSAPDCLVYFLLYPELRSIECDEHFSDEKYRSYYKDSSIARIRNNHYSFTALGSKSEFLYFHAGTIKLGVKLAGSFCEHRTFIPESMTETGRTYRLHETMHGWYYLPWSESDRPATSDWWKMDNSKREKLLGPDIDIDVYISETKEEDGVSIRFVTASDAVKNAPWRVELSVTGANLLENDHLAENLYGNEALTVKDGDVVLSNDKDSITIGPAFGNHHFMEGKEDSEDRAVGASTIYFTDYTPFDRTIFIRNRRDTIKL